MSQNFDDPFANGVDGPVDVKIEDGIPIPTYRVSRKTWPLAQMNVGQSFVLNHPAHVQNLREAISAWKRRHEEHRNWTVRRIADKQWRCWRIE